MAEKRIDAVFMAAATVGGILANSTRPAEFLYDNLAISSNVIEAGRRTSVKKLLFLGRLAFIRAWLPSRCGRRCS